MLFAPFKTVPKLLLTKPIAGILTTLAIFLPLTLIFLFLSSIVGAPAGSSTVGLIFASLALFFGLFFFLYSMKYYISVLLVLKMAQGGSAEQNRTIDKKQLTIDPSASSGQANQSQRSNVKGQMSNVISRIISKLGIGLLEVFHLRGIRAYLGGVLGGRPYRVNPLLLNLNEVELAGGPKPFVSVHAAIYNEKRVVERLIRATTSQEWSVESNKIHVTGNTKDENGSVSHVTGHVSPANYEVVIVDDSTDETTEIAKQTLIENGWQLSKGMGVGVGVAAGMGSGYGNTLNENDTGSYNQNENHQQETFVFTKPDGPTVKLIHRFTRSGFKGGALQEALVNTDPRAEYVTVFDADFVPYPDTLTQFVKTFQVLGGASSEGQRLASSEVSLNANANLLNAERSPIAAVQGYQ